MTKDELRAVIRERRRQLYLQGKDILAADSAAICRKIEQMQAFRNARTVLSYTPIKGEVDVSILDCSGKTVIKTDCDWNAIPAGMIDFAIIPGVAFAPLPKPSALPVCEDNAYSQEPYARRKWQSGYMRLGRGGGYFDRLIPLLHCPTVAPAFDFQLFGTLPLDPWDYPVDEIVTP